MPCSLEEFKDLMEKEAKDVACEDCLVKDLDVQSPPWLDEKLFTRGRLFIIKNIMAQLIATICGVITVMATAGTLDILVSTKKSSTPLSAYRRYLSVSLHIYAWMYSDLRPNTESWKSLVTIRQRHIRANNVSKLRGIGIISQKDLVITLFGFFGKALLKPNRIGMRFGNNEEIAAFIHFWRAIGYMVGIHDKYNFCDGSIDEVIEKAQYISDTCKVQLENPTQYFFHMVKAFLDGHYYISPLTNTKPFLYFIYRLNGISGFEKTTEESQQNLANGYNHYNGLNKKTPKDFIDNNSNLLKSMDKENRLDGKMFYESMSFVEKYTCSLMIRICEVYLLTTLGRWLFNMIFHVTYFFARFFPIVPFLRFGPKALFVNIFKESIAIPTVMKTNKEVLEELYKKNTYYLL